MRFRSCRTAISDSHEVRIRIAAWLRRSDDVDQWTGVCRREEIGLRRKRFVDRNWGSSGVAPMPRKRAASFDEIVENMGLSPAQYKSSAELKEWVRANRAQRYVPIDLLIAWGFDVEQL